MAVIEKCRVLGLIYAIQGRAYYLVKLANLSTFSSGCAKCT